MKTKWLFPHSCRVVGWLIFIVSVVVGLVTMNGNDPSDQSSIGWQLVHSSAILIEISGRGFADEVTGVGIIIGLLLVAFSREKVEDEMIGQLRLEALQWSVYANYLVLIIAILTVYDLAFLNVMIYNMFTVLLVFVFRFRWLLYRNNHNLLFL